MLLWSDFQSSSPWYPSSASLSTYCSRADKVAEQPALTGSDTLLDAQHASFFPDKYNLAAGKIIRQQREEKEEINLDRKRSKSIEDGQRGRPNNPRQQLENWLCDRWWGLDIRLRYASAIFSLPCNPIIPFSSFFSVWLEAKRGKRKGRDPAASLFTSKGDVQEAVLICSSL